MFAKWHLEHSDVLIYKFDETSFVTISLMRHILLNNLRNINTIVRIIFGWSYAKADQRSNKEFLLFAKYFQNHKLTE